MSSEKLSLRQRMINIMYLVLMAMLALNVSGELLNAFVTLDHGFNKSRETVERKNVSLYNRFSNAYELNKEKVDKPWHEALDIRTKSDTLVSYIQNLKKLFVTTVDGADATPNNFLSIDNQDVASQLMLTEKRGRRSKELKTTIVNYRDSLLTYLDPKNSSDTLLISSIKETFDVSSKKTAVGNVKKTWESIKFEHVPLAASISMLSKIQDDVRNFESDMVAHIFNKIDQNSFKFTTVKPLVVPISTQILKGDEYKAELLYAAYDETNLPKVIVNGKAITEYKDGKAVLTLPGEKVGLNKWDGSISIVGPEGNSVTQKITGEYIVNEPSAIISPLKMNVFYDGVVNPVKISIPGLSSSQLSVVMTNVSYSKKGDEYIVKPRHNTVGKKSQISIYAEINGEKRRMGSQLFRIKRVPDPVAKVANVTGGRVGKSILLAQKAIFAEMDNFDFDMSFKVTSFTVSALKGGFIVDERSRSNIITAAQKRLIRGLSVGTKVSFEDIRAKGQDGTTRKLGSITLVVG